MPAEREVTLKVKAILDRSTSANTFKPISESAKAAEADVAKAGKTVIATLAQIAKGSDGASLSIKGMGTSSSEAARTFSQRLGEVQNRLKETADLGDVLGNAIRNSLGIADLTRDIAIAQGTIQDKLSQPISAKSFDEFARKATERLREVRSQVETLRAGAERAMGGAVQAFGRFTAGIGTATRGLFLLAAAGDDSNKTLQNIVKNVVLVQAGFDLLKGGFQIVKEGVVIYKNLEAAILATATAQRLLNATQAAEVGGQVVGGVARGAAGRVGGQVAAGAVGGGVTVAATKASGALSALGGAATAALAALLALPAAVIGFAGIFPETTASILEWAGVLDLGTEKLDEFQKRAAERIEKEISARNQLVQQIAEEQVARQRIQRVQQAVADIEARGRATVVRGKAEREAGHRIAGELSRVGVGNAAFQAGVQAELSATGLGESRAKAEAAATAELFAANEQVAESIARQESTRNRITELLEKQRADEFDIDISLEERVGVEQELQRLMKEQDQLAVNRITAESRVADAIQNQQDALRDTQEQQNKLLQTVQQRIDTELRGQEEIAKGEAQRLREQIGSRVEQFGALKPGEQARITATLQRAQQQGFGALSQRELEQVRGFVPEEVGGEFRQRGRAAGFEALLNQFQTGQQARQKEAEAQGFAQQRQQVAQIQANVQNVINARMELSAEEIINGLVERVRPEIQKIEMDVAIALETTAKLRDEEIGRQRASQTIRAQQE